MKKLTLLLLLVVVAAPRPAQALQANELLALVAMPLAVAAVSEVSGVPQEQLADLVATLNNANVAPSDFVRMLRFLPPALAAAPLESQPSFVTFVQQHVDRGLTGTQLVTVIEQQLPSYGVTPAEITVTESPLPARTFVVDRDYVPVAVRTRTLQLRANPMPNAVPTAEVRGHPHGGPPGQIKKRIGVKTGAEVVHGSQPGRGAKRHETQVVLAPRTVVIEQAHGAGRGKGPGGGGPPGQQKKNGRGKSHGKG